ncbi:piggyBac transposable element-derived protein 3 [Nephila pilipes]|uniref:PiggyBac transposable element-derived protein 3 n=2 Tax=Nephila pilipes TaxID=299642 RepID=A0A8X6QFD4_NEPPI|nr:piggyBac transposable element-derived protein 3 [Nephila pilipes]
MVPYYGHHTCSMFIKGKPIKFSFKIWMLCSSSGYPYAMEIYSGRKNESPGMPQGEDGVTQPLSKITDLSRPEIYFDNFFTYYNLLKKLADSRIRATGTVQSSYIRLCPLLWIITQLPKRAEEQWITVVMALYSFTDGITVQL